MGTTNLAGAQIWQEHWDIRSGGNLLEYFVPEVDRRTQLVPN